MKHEIRLMALDEQPLVVDAWVRSFRDSPYAGCIGNDHFQAAQRRTVEDILLRPETRALVAIAPGPTKRVMGFVVFGGWFVFAKPCGFDWLVVWRCQYGPSCVVARSCRTEVLSATSTPSLKGHLGIVASGSERAGAA